MIGTGAKIIIEREIQRRNQQQQRSNTPRLSRNQTRQAQIALNNLGYNAGNPDGVAGNGTRAAIRRYQASIGVAPTGYLTREQLAALLNSGGTTTAAPAPSPGDNAAPQEELTRSQVLALQRGLNALGYDTGRPDGKTGRRTGKAVSAFLRDRGFDPYTTSPQDALAMVVRESGVEAPGGSTVASSPRETGAEVSVFDGANSESVADGFSRDDTATREEIDKTGWDAYKPELADKNFDLELELARRAIHSQPQIIDDDAVVVHWFEEVYPERLGHKAGGPDIARRYYQGTPFERKDVIAEFRRTISATATDEPLKITRSFQASLDTAKFDPTRGIPVFLFDAGVIRAQKKTLGGDRIYTSHIRRTAKMLFDNPPDIAHLPVTDETRAREIAELLGRNRYAKLRLETYLTINQVGAAVIEDSYSGNDLLTDATMDGVALVLYPGHNSEITEPNVLYRWDVASGSAAPAVAGLSAAEFAGWAGIRMVGGNLAVFENDSYSDYRDGGWRHFFDMGQLSANPDMLADDTAALFFGDMVLSNREKAFASQGKELFGGNRSEPGHRNGRNAFNEFEFPEVMQAFRDEYADKIKAHIPAWPLPVVHVTQVSLGDYDHGAGAFPLIFSNDRDRTGISSLNGAALRQARGKWRPERVETGLRSLPDRLEMAPDQARKLVEILATRKKMNNKRAVFIAAFSDARKPEPGIVRTGNRKGERALLFEMTPKRLALFADSGLRQLIREFEIGDGWNPRTLSLSLSGKTLRVDAETATLWRAANVAGFVDDREALIAQLAARKQIERRSERYRSPIPPVLPAPILEGQEEAQTADIDKFAALLKNLSASADFTILVHSEGLNGSLGTDGILNLRLDRTLGYGHWVDNPVFDEGERDAGHEAQLKALYPRAAGYRQIRTPGRGKAYLALRPNPAWFSVTIDTGLRGGSAGDYSGDLYLKVHEARHLADNGSGDAIVFEVEPLKVVFRSQDGHEFTHDVPPAESGGESGYPVSAMDVLGARIGMSLEEAVAAVKQAGYRGTQRKRISSQEYVLGNGLVLYDEAAGNYPHIAFFTKTYDDVERVIGISRYVPDHGAAPEAVVNAFTEKYGAPDGAYRYNGGSAYNAWGDTDVTKKLIQVEGISHECVLYPLRNTTLFDGTSMSVNVYELKKTCGVVLTTFVDDDMYTLLIDTNTVAAEHSRLLTEKQRKQEEAEAKEKAADIKL
ncbi:MAG: peptidoglycan-binding domain-containing protein [Rhizobiaceae bacterium]